MEDEPYVRDSIDDLLRSRGFDVSLESTVEAALRALERTPVDVVLTDLRLPGAEGIELVRRARAAFAELPIVVLTGYGTIASAVDCIKAGANDYILKPADPDVLELALERALSTSALRREVGYLREAGSRLGEAETPIGRSPAWLRTMAKVHAAAATESTVLLLGESGTGKGLLARLLHRLSPRARHPYVRVNCGAVPVEMWESEFFGHRKGAYTGAAADREGRFRLAHGGTLFMDEIGAMPSAAQAKLLRVLEDGEFDRLGDEQPTRVDVRVVAATNSDIDSEVASGRFRQDLFYRLNVVRIEVPPLRERTEDIPDLARRFTAEISSRLGRAAPDMSTDAVNDLVAYAWPGNVRELRNVIERALILGPNESSALPLGPHEGPNESPALPLGPNESPQTFDLPANQRPSGGLEPRHPSADDSFRSSLDLALAQGAATRARGAPEGGPPRPTTGLDSPSMADGGELNLRVVVGAREKEVLIAALRRSAGVRKEAARLLGIDQRNLAYYLRKHGVDPDDVPP